MKKLAAVLLTVLIFTAVYAKDNKLNERLTKYAGVKADSLITYLQNIKTAAPAEYGVAVFLLSECSPGDLASIGPAFVHQNIDLALKTRQLPWAKNIPDNVFNTYVLPWRCTQEPIEPWRPYLYKTLIPQMDSLTTIEQAATKINLWCNSVFYFVQTNGRDQAPLTSLRRGYGRCEEITILFMAACRSMGIPVRGVSAPYWNFMDNNHAWAEVWTPTGWRQTEGDYPMDTKSDNWVTHRAKRSTLVVSEAFGRVPGALKYENGASLVNVTANYGPVVPTVVRVVDAKNRPVAGAEVSYNAYSWGGVFSALELKSDSDGYCRVELGKGSLMITARKDELFAWGHLDMMTDHPKLTLVMQKKAPQALEFTGRFPLPPDPVNGGHDEFLPNYMLQRKLSDLSRQKDELSRQKPVDFLTYYPRRTGQADSAWVAGQKKYMEAGAKLGLATDQYLTLLKRYQNDPLRTEILNYMLINWDTKELVELPDTTAVDNLVQLFAAGKQRYNLPDSLFYNRVIKCPLSTPPYPLSAWHKEYAARFTDCFTSDPGTTAKAVMARLDSLLVADEDWPWCYFTPSLNPVQILNLKNCSPSHRRIAQICALQLAGVPVRWHAGLQYYDGHEFVSPPDQNRKEEPTATDKKLTLCLLVDNKPVKAEEWGNYQLFQLHKGDFGQTWTQTENRDLAAEIDYSPTKGAEYYVCAMVRNGNGDVFCHLEPVQGRDSLTIHLTTPAEYAQTELAPALVEGLKKLVTSDKALVFVVGPNWDEPHTRMFEQCSKAGIPLVMVSDFGGSPISSVKPVTANLPRLAAYPGIYLVDAQQGILGGACGFDLGLVPYLLKKAQP